MPCWFHMIEQYPSVFALSSHVAVQWNLSTPDCLSLDQKVSRLEKYLHKVQSQITEGVFGAFKSIQNIEVSPFQGLE